MSDLRLFTDPTWTAAYRPGNLVTEPHFAEVNCWGIVVEVSDQSITVRYDHHPRWEPFTTRYGSDRSLRRMFPGGGSEPHLASLTTGDLNRGPAPRQVPAAGPIGPES